ncbi:MAG: TetR/AcrR family transcriptional regulator C-terminal domain-containing protein [Oscillospiraceae bacterium]|nr:TetR/AcrR family transcriptional regulator C-terminal domain-containing protein [Oscillospiraceae bacterium]
MEYEAASMRTKKALAEALKRAMRKKPFSKITVSEIIADCGVNRKTFYYHFQDIYDLLKWVFEAEAIQVIKNFDLLVDYEEAITFVMDYVEENDYMINCACDSLGRDALERFFIADFNGIVADAIDSVEASAGSYLEPDYKAFLCKFYTQALSGILLEWAKDRNVREDREKTIGYLVRIFQSTAQRFIDQPSNNTAPAP